MEAWVNDILLSLCSVSFDQSNQETKNKVVSGTCDQAQAGLVSGTSNQNFSL